MNRKKTKKIQNAIEHGDLVPFSKVFHTYPKIRQDRIMAHARYIMAAMVLRELRKKQRLSQRELARKMNVKREFISQIESGQQNVTLETLYRVGAALGKKVEIFFK